MSVEIDASDLERALTDFVVDLEVEARDAMTRAAEIAAAKARELAPVAKGDLRSSIEPVYGIGSLLDGTLHGGITAGGEFASHAVYVDEGTRAHEIRARGRWMLRFQRGGATLFRRKVNHPGTRANPFMANAVELVLERIDDEFAAAVERAVRKAGLG